MYKRRTNAEMEALFDHVVEILDGYDGDRISIRHLCYRLASVGVIPKTEAAFSLVGKTSCQMALRRADFVQPIRRLDALVLRGKDLR